MTAAQEVWQRYVRHRIPCVFTGGAIFGLFLKFLHLNGDQAGRRSELPANWRYYTLHPQNLLHLPTTRAMLSDACFLVATCRRPSELAGGVQHFSPAVHKRAFNAEVHLPSWIVSSA